MQNTAGLKKYVTKINFQKKRESELYHFIVKIHL